MSQAVSRYRRIWIKDYPIMEVVILSAFTALIGYLNPFTRIDASELLEALFKECEEADFHEMCKASNRSATVTQIILALLMRIGLTIVSLGAKVPAGIFIPSMVWGALFGRLVGLGMQYFQQTYPNLPLFASCTAAGVDKECVTPGMYALLGAIGALGGVTRLTLALTVIMFELTGTLNYIVPCMGVLMVAKLVGDAFGAGMSDESIKVNGFPFLESATDNPALLVFLGRPVQDAMTPFSQLVVITKTLISVEDAENLLLENSTGLFRGFPVVRTLRGREFMGFVTVADIWFAIEAAKNEGLVEARLSGTDESTGSGISSANGLIRPISDSMVDLAPFINRTPFSVHPKMYLESVMDIFKKLGPRYLVVLHNGRLEGLITKKDLLKSLHEYEDGFDAASYESEIGSIAGDTISLIPWRSRSFNS
ncbi:glycerol ethanol, ferric requiring protein [Physocladia obscura]|uniref:Chloride channel protein n=1 Tax=Physocladia obscura TaxID=109957 RepID=A0AAD5T5M6_9FUNG|nr:glycerol ethanol, ferric requiring protein [Physocladia obscura]